MCAAVDDLTDNCVYATAYGWRLDQEAMNLCNRHQLCLACVSTPYYILHYILTKIFLNDFVANTANITLPIQRSGIKIRSYMYVRFISACKIRYQFKT